MSESTQRNQAKEPVTIRLDLNIKARLLELAQQQERTVSSLIDLAVREFLNRSSGGLVAHSPSAVKLRVRHANLPDTHVLHAYCTLAEERYNDSLKELVLPGIEFVDAPVEWGRLLTEVSEGKSDLVESVNWQALFWERKQYKSPSLDWVGPYLQLFVGHCVFVRPDHVSAYLDKGELDDFSQFRTRAKTGRDLSLRSLIAWATRSGDKKAERLNKLRLLWADAIVCCQPGTDYHIAVLRIAPTLEEGGDTNTSTGDRFDTVVQGTDSLDNGFRQFRNGTVTAFIGNLLHAAQLLADPSQGLLLAGPSDLRVPSLNTLAGHKGVFDGTLMSTDGPVSSTRDGVKALWKHAASWFRDEVVGAEADEPLREFVAKFFPELLKNSSERTGPLSDYAIFRSLMRTWVKWFPEPEDAEAFVGGKTAADTLVRQYEWLCELLNPSAKMVSHNGDQPEEARSLWKFPVLPEGLQDEHSMERRE